MALVFAPRRRDTLGVFCRLAQEAGLAVSQHQQYDSQVWDVHLKVRGRGLGGGAGLMGRGRGLGSRRHSPPLSVGISKMLAHIVFICHSV